MNEPKKNKNPVRPERLKSAVRELRTDYGDTQQEFAQRLKSAIRSVARYETDRPPRGTVLLKLWRLARLKKLDVLQSVFAAAISAELKDPKFQAGLIGAMEESVDSESENLGVSTRDEITLDLTASDLREDERRALTTALGILKTSRPEDRQLFIKSLQSIDEFKRLLRRAELMAELEQKLSERGAQAEEYGDTD